MPDLAWLFDLVGGPGRLLVATLLTLVIIWVTAFID
jgi:hypothetical protein